MYNYASGQAEPQWQATLVAGDKENVSNTLYILIITGEKRNVKNF